MILNLLGVYFFIFIPTDRLLYLKDREQILTGNIERIQGNIRNRKAKLEEIQEKEKTVDEEESREEKTYFENSYEALSTIDSFLKRDRIEIEAMGRDKITKLKENLYLNRVHIVLNGKEKDIYSFFKNIERSGKEIYFAKEGTRVLTQGEDLKIELELMYIDKNKKKNVEKRDYEEFLQGITPTRKIEGKRRKI